MDLKNFKVQEAANKKYKSTDDYAKKILAAVAKCLPIPD